MPFSSHTKLNIEIRECQINRKIFRKWLLGNWKYQSRDTSKKKRRCGTNVISIFMWFSPLLDPTTIFKRFFLFLPNRVGDETEERSLILLQLRFVKINSNSKQKTGRFDGNGFFLLYSTHFTWLHWLLTSRSRFFKNVSEKVDRRNNLANEAIEL